MKLSYKSISGFRLFFKFLLCTSLITLISNPLWAQAFTEDATATAGLADVNLSAAAWGDYDNDDDLDILLTGFDGSTPISEVFRNDAGSFTDINAGLTGVSDGAVAWGDYDNDGDLDILLAGLNSSIIYRNDAGSFIDISAGLTGVANAAVAWGDYDNDGDLDIVLSGNNISRIYRNDGGSFSDISAGLLDLRLGAVAWGDYDNDRDLDLLLTGDDNTSFPHAIVYRNDNGSFVDISAGLTGVVNSSVAWGDYDNDGELDIVLAGMDAFGVRKSIIYRNDAGSFTDIAAGLTGVDFSSVAWADYNNDGDVEILLTGWTGGTPISRVYEFAVGTFNNINAGLTGVFQSSAAWGDYDNDGDLDILLTGNDGSRTSIVYRNNAAVANTAPAAPSNLNAVVDGNDVTFSWQAATDGQTPAAGLTYNLRVGTTPGGSEIISAMADGSNGYRRLPAVGNTNHNTSWDITLPGGNEYFWSVQAVDQGFSGSAFAGESSLNNFFTEDANASVGLNALEDGSVAWGDYDNDGDLDILLNGFDGSTAISKVYRNDGSSFIDINAGLSALEDGSVAWGDYDNDGDLDIVLTGSTDGSNSGATTKVYRNDGGSFIDINAGLTGVYFDSKATWGDYDNDGDLDILIIGADVGLNSIAKVYRNDGGSFVDINAGLTGVFNGAAAWGDFDNDGDLDILLTGETGSYIDSKVYRNDGGSFIEINDGLPSCENSSVAWGDYDNDGDLDILLSGINLLISNVYRNDSGIFNDIGAGLTPVFAGSGAWGDYDNDGDLDILLTGKDFSGTVPSKVYRNDGGTFSNISAGLIGVENINSNNSAVWGDYDNDGDLDILLTGSDNTGTGISKVYRNNIATANTVPTSPEGLLAAFDSDFLNLQWNPATDSETPQAGLSYNLIINGTDGIDIKSPMADTSGGANHGYRRVVELGNIHQNTDWSLQVLPHLSDISPNPFMTWSVQAVDHAFAGSPFSIPDTFLTAGQIISANDVPGDQGGQVVLAWYASGFDTDVEFLTHYSIWRAVPLGTAPNGPLLEAADIGLNYEGEAHRITPLNGAFFAWQWIANQTAQRFAAYSYAVPTLNDSTSLSDGKHYFLISAHTNDPNTFFNSLPDSGYSVDDLAPVQPQNLAGQLSSTDIELTWDPNPESDLLRYLVYRSDSPNIDPQQTALLATTTESAYIDSLPLTGNNYYIVLAEDIHENLSPPSNEVVVEQLLVFTKVTLPGWNMVGLPYLPGDGHYQSVFPNSNENTFFGFNGSYVIEDSFQVGTGYWLNFPVLEFVPISGSFIDDITINLTAGWNMISGISGNIALSDIGDPGGIINPGTLFGFSGSYVLSDSIKQGEGYWINANADGQIMLSSSTARMLGKRGNGESENRGQRERLAMGLEDLVDLTQYIELQISDGEGRTQVLHYRPETATQQTAAATATFLLPPPAPAAQLDARFAGDYRLTRGNQATIQLQAIHYPLTIQIRNFRTPAALPGEAAFQLVLKEVAGNRETARHPLSESLLIELHNPRVNKLVLAKEAIVPVEFRVYQNYPNPFNPTTSIRYDLPEKGPVEIAIYNTVGQKIRSLRSAEQEPGVYETTWDATDDAGINVSSGIYYYRVSAGNHSLVKKMLFLK